MAEDFDRTELVASLLKERGDKHLVICGLGSSCFDVMETSEHPQNFYLWGAMGQAVPVGLGLATARPDNHVLVITGDGELLMALGSLATVANETPANFSILVLDNGAYAETGGQPTHTAGPVDLAQIAEGAGFRNTRTVRSWGEFDDDCRKLLLESGHGPAMIVAKVPMKSYGPTTRPELRHGAALTLRFRESVLGSAHEPI